MLFTNVLRCVAVVVPFFMVSAGSLLFCCFALVFLAYGFLWFQRAVFNLIFYLRAVLDLLAVLSGKLGTGLLLVLFLHVFLLLSFLVSAVSFCLLVWSLRARLLVCASLFLCSLFNVSCLLFFVVSARTLCF